MWHAGFLVKISLYGGHTEIPRKLLHGCKKRLLLLFFSLYSMGLSTFANISVVKLLTISLLLLINKISLSENVMYQLIQKLSILNKMDITKFLYVLRNQIVPKIKLIHKFTK